jgi:Na+-driven multidrug efflux pump
MRVEGILFMPLMALSMAVSAIVGQNLGAHKPERAFTAGWHVTHMGILLLLALSIAMYIFAPQLSAVMSHDPVTIAYTIDYLRINAIAEPFLALGMILSGALQGAGDTRSPMWISLISNWIVRLPLAWLLAITFKLGPAGAWIAMSSSMALTGLLMTWRYQSKDWLNTKV